MVRKRKKFRFGLINIHNFRLKHKIFAFFIILIFLIFLYIKFLATPLILSSTETQLSSFATKSINYAISDIMNQNIAYSELISIDKDAENNISFIEANSVKINILSRTMSKVVMSNFLELAKSPIKIPLGSFSGISLLAGVGPKVAFNVNPYGEVNCYFSSKFESAGINQTYHKIYMQIEILVNVVFPTKRVKLSSSSDALLCETLIVGKIPDVYLNSNNLTDMLNLVPSRFTS